ncbi:hypothetical protein C2845_PM17G12030 [Panicum miliaceum]|uniref:Uncharacterized protein n=1 Tax=Panicum miliaceum TaxID=4540 RepID=A0A3L6Q2U9_PANMI|nr:hypothetical protein C2845_PM17G12030 [Panicum miliaceum]
MKKKPVSIELPKFEISFSWSDLKRDLRRLGLSLPFSREIVDLRSMCMGTTSPAVHDVLPAEYCFTAVTLVFRWIQSPGS